MVDFLMVSERLTKKAGLETYEVYPKFKIKNPSNDLMIKGGDFYAVWDERKGLWSTSEQDAIEIIDGELDNYAEENRSRYEPRPVRVLHMWDAETGMIDRWHNYCKKQMRDSFHMLDEKLIFSNMEVKKEDFASKKLPYPLEAGKTDAWDKLIGTLYGDKEKHKIEWCIGSIVNGASKKLQKFMVLYGEPGSGKSTLLDIIDKKLFAGYTDSVDSQALGSATNTFALESFKNNPLVAIQHEGNLSRIEDNTRLNSLVSHDKMTVNEKFKGIYTNAFKSFLILSSNKPVKITDAKSGLLRRLIDVSPTGNLLPRAEYNRLNKQIDFELGAIAEKCKRVYEDNPAYYDGYIPVNMLGATNDFYNFVMDNWPLFRKQNQTTLKSAWGLYNLYCEEARVAYPYSQRAFKEELKNYFHEFQERATVDGVRVRNLYIGFRADKFDEKDETEEDRKDGVPEWLHLTDHQTSLLDTYLADMPAQYPTEEGRLERKWVNCRTHLKDLDTHKLHHVKVPEQMIVVDFDISVDGEKNLERNLQEAAKWPATYAELSKSGKAIHLHYLYTGDVRELSSVYDEQIEIKTLLGDASLRRCLTKCNDIPIATLSSGLPKKEVKKTVDIKQIQSEKGLRTLILRNLAKEIHQGTKPSMDFIEKILDDAYESGLSYDISDMRNAITAFAAGSTNHKDYCLKAVNRLKYKGKEAETSSEPETGEPIVFFDIEVFPNLLLINYKAEGDDKPMHRMINPAPAEMEELFKLKLVGYNNRKYDNHIIYARYLGKSNEEIYQMSKAIVSGTKEEQRAAMYGEAYNLSYTDVYDFASAGNKMSLKKAEIEMGIHHLELGMDWDQPVPEEEWTKVSEYCDNDVIATEARFHYLKADWIARQILSDLAGMTVNDTTNTLTTKFIFGDNRTPQREFNYRNLGQPVRSGDCPKSMIEFLNNAKPDMINAAPFVHPLNPGVESLLPYFPGYKFEWTEKVVAGRKIRQPVSTYRGEVVGEGGYVYSEAGIYTNVALLDITSMHPNSSIDECIFGARYTLMLKELIDARVAIKHEDWDSVSKMLDGRLIPYVEKVLAGEITSNDLALALKTAINSVYGLSSAKFQNAFKDPRNQDNLVAKRGALFMIDLKHAVQEQGFTVAHIKTDSIKIPNATPSIIQFVMDFGKKYGYNFEHEATYSKMCLVNKAVYIAKYKDGKPHRYKLSTGEVVETPWTATGTQFQQPYVFKELFAKAPIKFDDLCETKNVKTALYLDMNEGFPLHSYSQEEYDKEIERISNDVVKKNQLKINNDANPDAKREELIANAVKKYKGPKPGDLVETHNYVFVGRSGQFCPIKEGAGGGKLMREQDGKFVSATDADGYRWLESEMLRNLGMENSVELDYYRKKVDEAVESISSYGDFEWFISDDDSSDVIEVP